MTEPEDIVMQSTVSLDKRRYEYSKPRKFLASKDTSEDDIELSDIESEIPLPHNTIWRQIQLETKEKELKQHALELELNAEEDKPVHLEISFLEEHIFPLLLPILTNTILAAEAMNCLTNQKNLFNGIDFIAQLLYNCNPKYPGRKRRNQHILSMEWTKKILKEKKRPIFPKSYLWKKEEAALVIQSFVKGHMVRKMEEVQEMRQFWKTIKKEKLDRIKQEAEEKELLIRMQYLH